MCFIFFVWSFEELKHDEIETIFFLVSAVAVYEMRMKNICE